ncbi:MAG TPA: hypothetical protein VHE81_09570 [Lacipirellulaceae bacterium]|nr:hypothetical protein [Lacipirellulaceae bacterium]
MSRTPIQKHIADRIKGGVISILRTEGIYRTDLRFPVAKELLAQTNLDSALQVMAILNEVAMRFEKLKDFNSPENLKHLGNLYGFLFAPKVQGRVRRLTLRELPQTVGPFRPLSPWACAAMTNACLRFCHRSSGAKVWPPSTTEHFGRILLSFQTHLAPERSRPPLPDFERMDDEQFKEFARNQLRANRYDVTGEDRLRLYAMFEIPAISDVLVEKCGKTAAEWFQEQTGISTEEYRFTVLGLMATILEFRLEHPEWEKLTFDLTTFLAHLKPEARQSFVRLIELAAIDLDSLRAETPPNSWNSAVYGPNALLRRQLMRIGPTRFVILHHGFFVQRYFRGWMHLLDDLARRPGSARSWPQVRSECGYLFEGYIRWWLRNLFGPDARYLFGENVVPGKERDAVVVIGNTAIVCESNHHWLSRVETYEATPAKLAAIVVSDLKKAIEAAEKVASEGITIDGERLRVDCVLPIAILPEALPISELTMIRFKQELLQLIPKLDGGGRVRGAQILTQNSIEQFDKVWHLPDQVMELVNYLERRASLEPARFGPAVFDLQELEIRHTGTIWERLYALDSEEFTTKGKERFQNHGQMTGGQ